MVAGAWSEVEAQPRLWRLPARTRVFVSHTNSSQTFGRQRDAERLRDSRQGSSSLQSASAWPLFKAPVQEPWCLDVGQTNVSACSAESSGSFVPMLLQFTGTSGSFRLGQTPPRPSQIVTVLIGGVDCFNELKQQNKPHDSKFLRNPQKSRCLLVESCLTLDDLCVFINHNKRQSQPGLVYLAMYR